MTFASNEETLAFMRWLQRLPKPSHLNGWHVWNLYLSWKALA